MTLFFPSAMGMGGAGKTWTQVFAPTINTTGSSLSYDGYTIVQTIPFASFSQTGGSQIRITFGGAPSGEDTEFAALWVGNGGGAQAVDFTGDQVQLKKSGSNTITIPQGGTLVTDGAAFTKDGSNTLVIAAHFSNSAKDALPVITDVTFGTLYYGAVAGDAGTQDKTGASYGAFGGNSLHITKIELLI